MIIYGHDCNLVYSLVFSLILLTGCCNAQLPIIQDTITCGDIVNGTTTASDNTHYYLFVPYNDSKSVLLDLCDSDYDTYIYLYDANMAQLDENDYSYECYPKSQLYYSNLANDEYIIGIPGSYSDYGNYEMEISCHKIQFLYTCMCLSILLLCCSIVFLTVCLFCYRFCKQRRHRR